MFGAHVRRVERRGDHGFSAAAAEGVGGFPQCL
jgi:hypothetical protein